MWFESWKITFFASNTSQKKTTKQLGLSKSYAINSLLQEIQQGKDRVDEVTKLKAKYGESLDSIIAKHGAEYQSAVEQDSKVKKQQATAILPAKSSGLLHRQPQTTVVR